MSDLEWAQAPEEIQGGAAWHGWRKQGLGASDAPIIMNASPWKTPYQLWLEKTGQKKRDTTTNWAQSRGNRLEPIARMKYEETFAMKMPAKVFKEGNLLASMDGWNADFNGGLEIKCPGYPDHAKCMAGEIPDKYIWQLVHQAIVTKADWIDYFSYHVEKDGDERNGDCQWIRFEATQEQINDYISHATRFWHCVQTKEAPPMGDKDFLPVSDSNLTILAERYETAKDEADLAKSKLEHVKEQILEIVRGKGWKRIECGRMKVYEITRKGTVDMKEVGNAVDVEKYRKPDSKFFKIDMAEI